MLKGIGLTRIIGDRAILDDVSFQVDEGAIATVLGPSGSGKTTLLRLIMGLETADAGELFIGDRLLSGPGVHVPAENRGFSMVFQEFTLFPHLNVEANLTFGLERGTDTDAVLDELLALLEIESLRRRRIDQLSGGEQQRVALARALAVREGGSSASTGTARSSGTSSTPRAPTATTTTSHRCPTATSC